MTPMTPTTLRTLATVSAGQGAPKDNEFSESGTPFVRAGSLEALIGGKSEVELELVSDEIAKRRKLRLYPKGTVVFAKSGMSATKDRIYVLQSPAYVVSHLATLVPKVGTHTNYLCLALKAFPPSKLIKDFAYPAISLGDIENFTIPVPETFDDQIRIAHLLGKMEELIAQRKQLLKQLDELLKSVFVEMFGDPVRNEKGWDKIPFAELLDDIESGKSPKCHAREAAAGEWGVLKLGAVTRCTFDGSKNKALPDDVLPSTRDEVKTGDLLFSRKNTYELVAACAYVFHTRPRLLMPDLIFRFVFKKTAPTNPIFVWKLLTNDSQRKAVQSLAAGAAGSMPNISKTNLKAVRLPIPPLPLQTQFANIVEKVEALRSRHQQSLTDLEALYGALSQQAFKGELDLSRVPLPNTERQEAQTAMPAAGSSPDALPTAIDLPDTNLLLAVLNDRARLKDLLCFWLEAYCVRLNGVTISARAFLDDAQTRIAELHPDKDFELGVEAYELVKTWVFDRIESRELKQTRDIVSIGGKRNFGNKVVLRARGSRLS